MDRQLVPQSRRRVGKRTRRLVARPDQRSDLSCYPLAACARTKPSKPISQPTGPVRPAAGRRTWDCLRGCCRRRYVPFHRPTTHHPSIHQSPNPQSPNLQPINRQCQSAEAEVEAREGTILRPATACGYTELGPTRIDLLVGATI